MRIGIHTGSSVAGIIGTDLVRFDVYGKDSVIANKMESGGEPGKINVSLSTRQMLEKLDFCQFGFEDHTTIDIPDLKESVQCFFVKYDGL